MTNVYLYLYIIFDKCHHGCYVLVLGQVRSRAVPTCSPLDESPSHHRALIEQLKGTAAVLWRYAETVTTLILCVQQGFNQQPSASQLRILWNELLLPKVKIQSSSLHF